MSDSDPFAAADEPVTGRWARVGATADEAAALGGDEAVAGVSDGDLRERLAAHRAQATGEAPEGSQEPSEAEAAGIEPEPSDDGAQGDTAPDAVEASQVTPPEE
jgi:hypothetical protein